MADKFEIGKAYRLVDGSVDNNGMVWVVERKERGAVPHQGVNFFFGRTLYAPYRKLGPRWASCSSERYEELSEEETTLYLLAEGARNEEKP